MERRRLDGDRHRAPARVPALIAATHVGTIVPYVALILALATFIAGQLEVRRRAKVDYVAELERRIETCERDRERMHRKSDDQDRQIATLKDENYDLLRRLADHERDDR